MKASCHSLAAAFSAAVLGFGLVACEKNSDSTNTVDPRPTTKSKAAADSAPSTDAGELPALPNDVDYYHGIYLQGAKVGWMRSVRKDEGHSIRLIMTLDAAIRGMGQVSKIDLSEERVFKNGRLATIEFNQRAAQSAVKVVGKAEGDTLKLTINAGGHATIQEHPLKDTLAVEESLRQLVHDAKVGATAEGSRFDASVQKQLRFTHRVEAVEKKLFGGVWVDAVKVTSEFPQMGVKESGWYDRQGAMLEARVGGMFMARLESPEVAKDVDYQQDILVSAVVKPPAPIVDQEKLAALEVVFKGYSGDLPEASHRQKATSEGDATRFVLQKDSAPTLSLAEAVALGTKNQKYIEATPFIQSGHADLIAEAKRIVGGAESLFEATSRLSTYVYSHVQDAYVPAYSNALDAYRSGLGDCTEHSVLFVGLARALGIPSRVAVGIAYWRPGGGFGWHAWAEVLTENGWYAVDPTWNQPIADATHIRFAGGGPLQQARIVMLLGALEITDVKL